MCVCVRVWYVRFVVVVDVFTSVCMCLCIFQCAAGKNVCRHRMNGKQTGRQAPNVDEKEIVKRNAITLNNE